METQRCGCGARYFQIQSIGQKRVDLIELGVRTRKLRGPGGKFVEEPILGRGETRLARFTKGPEAHKGLLFLIGEGAILCPWLGLPRKRPCASCQQ